MLDVIDAGRRTDGDWMWRHLHLRLEPGERVGLSGPSGSGKTLFLRSLAGLDPLDEGTVVLDGIALEDSEIPAYRSRVAFLPQDAVLEEGSVEESLRSPFAFRVHRQRSYEESKALRLLSVLGRDASFLEKRSSDLSGGERQVTALVRVLLLAPDILLLDEPTASMDEALARGAETLVSSWMSEAGAHRALIWTSHQAARLDRVANRHFELEDFRP